MDILNQLNSKQKEAVININGPILIIAGAGSGKTKTITHRIIYLISQGISPQNIMAVTFTNKAAEEMRERINPLISRGNSPFVGTFHSFGAKILRQEVENQLSANKKTLNKNFVIFDENDQLALVKDIIKSLEIDPKQYNHSAILNSISKAKNELKTPEEFSENTEGIFKATVAKIYHRYQADLETHNAVDFDDILMKTVNIFKKFPEILEKYQDIFKYILVDEYQDTNFAQYTLVNLLAKKYRNLCAVGDDYQAIYSWRGADFRNILNFEKDYPEAKIILLEENYRSTQNILNAAHAVIEKNIFKTNKKLWTKNPAGNSINLCLLNNEKEEGEFIAQTVKNISLKENLLLNNFAVLYRTNAQSRSLEEAFLSAGIPYKIIGNIKFYSRKEIKDIISYLRLIQNSDDALSMARIINTPPRGIGKTTQEKFFSRQESLPPKIQDFFNLIENLRERSKIENLPQLIESIIKKSGYEDYLQSGTIEDKSRLENIKELLSLAQKYKHLEPQNAIQKFLEDIALISDSDDIENNKNLVNLMTLHAAKGLEFPVVFIAGAEEGLLPHSQSIINSRDLEEERRLCYVGMTRAKKELFVTSVRRRMIFGATQANPPSRFLLEIPENLINLITDYEPTIEI